MEGGSNYEAQSSAQKITKMQHVLGAWNHGREEKKRLNSAAAVEEDDHHDRGKETPAKTKPKTPKTSPPPKGHATYSGAIQGPNSFYQDAHPSSAYYQGQSFANSNYMPLQAHLYAGANYTTQPNSYTPQASSNLPQQLFSGYPRQASNYSSGPTSPHSDNFQGNPHSQQPHPQSRYGEYAERPQLSSYHSAPAETYQQHMR
ncbi:MAG: hypothetical protein MMC23_009863 [Stictis urceolatum]|nr:hypothetical protein [Stictis urceolata]